MQSVPWDHPGLETANILSLLLGITLSIGATLPAGAQTAEEPEPTPKGPTLADYRRHALGRDGDPKHGRRIFQDPRAQCLQCHSIDGRASKAGPDLYAAGDKFSRADLIESILDPSSTILIGYGTTVVDTRDGESFAGVLKSAPDSDLLLAAPGDTPPPILVANVAQRRTESHSLMPEGLHAGLSLDEFSHLIAYLESLKQPGSQLANQRGTPKEIPPISRPVSIIPIHPPDQAFTKPVWLAEHPTIADTFLVAEQTTARIWWLDLRDEPASKDLFVDLSGEVFISEFEGLLGVALHPDIANNHRYYIMHEIMNAGKRAMIIAERLAGADLQADSGTPSRRVMRIDVGTEVHHGGGLEFGPDGFLYIGMGDAGPQEDPQGHGQDLTSRAGKLHRIDVDATSPGRAYAIPPDNPFADHADPAVHPEIFAYGLRQPWRFSFDPRTGDLWVGEVGQVRFEEITIVRAGENHGWNVYEGFSLFSTEHRRDEERYISPVVAFGRRHGVSITGGYVYRGQRNPSYDGVYICGDYQSTRLWGLTQQDRRLTTIREIGKAPTRFASFGRDQEGELYLVGYDNGMIYRIDLTGSVFTKE